MQTASKGDSRARCAFLLGTLALTGCVPSGFVYDLPQDGYYSGGSGYYSAAQPGYYGQQVYYGQSGYVPRVIYVDHDHDRNDCRHESHRDRRDERNDHDRRDAPADGPPPPRAPRGVTPKDTEQPARPEAGPNPCAGGKKCGPVALMREVDATRRRTETRDGSRLVAE